MQEHQKNEAMFEVLDKKVRSSPRSPVARLVMVVEESGREGVVGQEWNPRQTASSSRRPEPWLISPGLTFCGGLWSMTMTNVRFKGCGTFSCFCFPSNRFYKLSTNRMASARRLFKLSIQAYDMSTTLRSYTKVARKERKLGYKCRE